MNIDPKLCKQLIFKRNYSDHTDQAESIVRYAYQSLSLGESLQIVQGFAQHFFWNDDMDNCVKVLKCMADAGNFSMQKQLTNSFLKRHEGVVHSFCGCSFADRHVNGTVSSYSMMNKTVSMTEFFAAVHRQLSPAIIQNWQDSSPQAKSAPQVVI